MSHAAAALNNLSADTSITHFALPELKQITAAHLMRALGLACPDWQAFWLHDDGADVIGVLPKKSWTLDNHTGTLICHTHSRTDSRYQCTSTPCDYTHYQATLMHYHHRLRTRRERPSAAYASVNPHANRPRYQHGLMGYVSYDIAAHALNPAIALTARTLAYFGHYDLCLKQTADGVWVLHFADICPTAHHALMAQIKNALPAILAQLNTTPTPRPIALQPVWTPADYARAFHTTQAYLHAGDAYQVNLTQCFSGTLEHAETTRPLLEHLPRLYQATNAPFCAYLAVGGDEILSVSPELFFSFQAVDDGVRLVTKPIKGTRPRGQTAQADHALKMALASSEKDLAENVMIVDLLRNDLGRYAKFGAVNVPVRFAIESFSNVHHMVSTVQATLSEDTPALKALFDSLPAGSITGSPKKRACELIFELEGMPRGAYCGSMGYLNFNDTGQWNVLIRTLQSYANTADSVRMDAWAGGGITVLSAQAEEYQECLDKVGQIQALLALTPKA